MDRYIGLDAHTSSCTVATIGPSGKRLRSQVVENAVDLLGLGDESNYAHFFAAAGTC